MSESDGGALVPGPVPQPQRARLRIRFSKVGKIRWTSHRDLARMWERAFRRVQLPLAYSEGFSPRPKVSFGLALPTGHESVAEYLDVEVSDVGRVDLSDLVARLSAALPVGVDATSVAVLDPGVRSLQEEVTSSTWRWVAAPIDGSTPITRDELAGRVAAALAAPTLTATRNRKGVDETEDIRPGLLDLKVLEPAGPDSRDGVWLEAELACSPRSVRPAEVLSALGPGLEERNVRRLNQWISREGARREPLGGTTPDVATNAPHAWVRAS